MINALKRILLVEDSRNDVEMTIEALAEHALANQVDVVRDGEEALDYLLKRGAFANRKTGNPVVILLDVKLPKLNGIEVLKTVRQQEGALQRVPVVMLTSSREEPDLEAAYRLGCNAYVVKPVGFEDFCKSLKLVGCFWAVLNEPPDKGLLP